MAMGWSNWGSSEVEIPSCKPGQLINKITHDTYISQFDFQIYMHTNIGKLAIKMKAKELIGMVWWTKMALVHIKEYAQRMVDVTLSSFYLK